MRFLFVHRNFPAQYIHLVRSLRDRGHEIVFVTGPNDNTMHGVKKIEYSFAAEINETTHPGASSYDLALRRADAVATVGDYLKKTGFRPDIVIGHHGWGELLNIQDVWPDVPLLGYFEFYYHPRGFDTGFDPEFQTDPHTRRWIRARNAINHLALTNPGHGQTPTEFQLSTYPEQFHRTISLIREGVDLAACAPDPAIRAAPLPLRDLAAEPAKAALGDVVVTQAEKLVTHVNNNLEPCRGLHILMRALPRLLARKDVRVVIVGAEGTGYGPRLPQGTWKQHFLAEMAGKYDESRVHFVGSLAYDSYRTLLRRSDAHVYLTYPFVVSWSLREALACGCPVVASDTLPVHEFIQHGRNGLLTPFFDPAGLADRILGLLEDDWLDGHIRANARRFAERHLSMSGYLSRYGEVIQSLTGALK